MTNDSSNTPQDSRENVNTELTNLFNRIGVETDRMVGTGNRLIGELQKQSNAQSRHQKAIIWLTIVIAVATVFYAYINWLSVKAMREANEIQRQQIQTTNVSK